ncbi:unnamed protein product [Anisakis simplex]|uniref:Uncharacterized protein n=1 Tax=Anisakis simplex TaxID=6269 RepID=A0A0M3K905_ANISI|nr:unnamed protein product [Anisakis simplex]
MKCYKAYVQTLWVSSEVILIVSNKYFSYRIQVTANNVICMSVSLSS